MCDDQRSRPLFAGGFQAIKAGQYELLFLPDLHNDELQREGKPPVYYWMPGAVRLSRANVDTGPREFHLTHFLGVQSADTTVGATGTREVAGGLITFTTTAAPPAAELEAAQNALADMFKGKDDHFWGWRTPVAPAFRPMPVMSCTTSLTNLAPKANGAVPGVVDPGSGRQAREAAPGALRELRMLLRWRSRSGAAPCARAAPMPRTTSIPGTSTCRGRATAASICWARPRIPA